MQSPSNLIFFVLLGVWAAFFLQYWIRRREHLATARAADQFSEAMRVLDRTDRSERVAATAAETPAVDRSRGTGSTEPDASSTGHRARPSTPISRPAAASIPALSAPSGPRITASVPRPAAPAPAPASRPVPRAGRVRPGIRLRGLLFLAVLIGTAVVGGLAATGILLWWSSLIAAGVLALAFLFLRAGVARQRRITAARRHTGAQGRRPAAARRSTATRRTVQARRASAPAAPRSSSPAPAGEPAAAGPAVVEPVAPEAATPAPSDQVAAPAARDTSTPYGFGADDGDPAVQDEVRYVHMVDEDDIPLTWDPVPVPRPTYTMKAMAPRPEVRPAEVTGSVAPSVEDAPLEARRVAGA